MTAPARLSAQELAARAAQRPAWTVEEGRRLRRAFRFPDFAAALAFVNRVGAEAEALGHHPDVELGWGRVVLTLSTHDAGGLTALDFELAARVDALAPAPV